MKPGFRIWLVSALLLAWLAVAIFGWSPRAWDPLVGEWKESKGRIIEIGVQATSSSSPKALYHFKRKGEDSPEPSSPAADTKPNDLFPARPFTLWSRKWEFFADGTFKLSDADGEYASGKWVRIPVPVYRVTEDFLSHQLETYYTEEELNSIPRLRAEGRVELCARARAYCLEGFPRRIVVVNDENQLAATRGERDFWKHERTSWQTQAHRQIRIWLGLPQRYPPYPSSPAISPILFPPATPATPPHPVPAPTPIPRPASP